MIVLAGTNVNDLYTQGITLIQENGKPDKSRAGDVLVMPCPVMSVYEKPMERVLFDQRRDANPFFHLFEGLWMLSGSNDVDPLTHYVKDFSRFAEDDGIIHGAYGYRWRTEFGFNQLDVIVQKLRTNPQDRQAVLQMWDCSMCDDLTLNWKDRPCNTHCYFRARDGELDMTIMCRSNDIIWGAYGANAVHFSMLLEYMAGRIGIRVGKMYQLSNNFHAYTDMLEKVGTPKILPYAADMTTPMADDWKYWDHDLESFMKWHGWLWTLESNATDIDMPDNIKNVWFYMVAGSMCVINWYWKNKRYNDAREFLQHVEAPDWRAAAGLWMNRRLNAGNL